jgi:hypothetical protein
MFLNFAAMALDTNPFAVGAADLQCGNEARHPLTSRRLRRRPYVSTGQSSGEPEHNKNNKHQPENAA